MSDWLFYGNINKIIIKKDTKRDIMQSKEKDKIGGRVVIIWTKSQRQHANSRTTDGDNM